MLAFLGFGIMMGIIFPFFSSLFVNFKDGLYWWFVVSCLGAGIIMGLANYYLLKIILVNKLQDLSKMTNAISHHDLTVNYSLQSDDVIGEIADSFNRMADTLREMVSELLNSCDAMHTGVEQICITAGEADHGVQQQYQETSSILSAIEDMTIASSDVSQNASDASNTASSAKSHTQNANLVVKETILSINSLADAVSSAANSINQLEIESSNIGGVLDVIEGISEQTNLLALNAAIEAARAGEQGRGFAVVADEVRMLAQRTKESTTEIQKMIEKLQSVAESTVTTMSRGQQQAKDSVEHIAEAGDVIEQIETDVVNISNSNESINVQSNQQTDMVKNIDTRMSSIHDISTTSMELSKKTFEESRTLTQLADKLEALVRKFKI